MRLRPVRLALALVLLLTSPALAWNNGQPGNANTDTTAECSNPPYATHDWIAEQALMLLPQAERDWLMPHKPVYLIGTEAPDFKLIPTACQTPHRGYDDRSSGHSVEWASDGSHMVKDRAAQPRVTARGEGPILSAAQMESLWAAKPQSYLESIGHSLNLGVNELADVLHTFFLNVVSEEDD